MFGFTKIHVSTHLGNNGKVSYCSNTFILKFHLLNTSNFQQNLLEMHKVGSFNGKSADKRCNIEENMRVSHACSYVRDILVYTPPKILHHNVVTGH